MKLLGWIDIEKLGLFNLSNNLNAIHLLEQNPEKIDWNCLSINSNAIQLLEQNPEKINWFLLSKNPSIFTYDYEKIKKNFEELAEEIIAKALHPKRIQKLKEENFLNKLSKFVSEKIEEIIKCVLQCAVCTAVFGNGVFWETVPCDVINICRP